MSDDLPQEFSGGSQKSIFRRKPVELVIDENQGDGLERSLNLWQLTAIGVGGIIGAGIFSLAGSVANTKAGPAVLISFLIAGCASAAAALSYAEFAGMIPKAGSAYTYGYVVLGEFVAWFIGWDLLLEYVAIVAVVAIGVSGYFTFLLEQIGLTLPPGIMHSAGSGVQGGVVDVFAVILCLLTAWILTRGIQKAGRYELWIVALKVLLVLFIIGVGFFHINSANYQPYFPFGFSGVMTGAATVFFAVFGYDAMSTAAEESKDAKKHMPKAILLSLAVAMVLYIGVTLVLTGMRKYTEINPESGLSHAFNDLGMPAVANVVACGAIISIVTVLVTFMLGVTRVWFSMSRDGLLPAWFGKINPKTHVPTRVTWLAGGGAAVLAGLFPINLVAELTNIGILSAFIIVCLAVIVLRYRRPDIPRAFKLPFMPVIPIAGIVFSVWLILSLPYETWVRFLVWLLIGVVVYWTYSRKNSLMNPDSNRIKKAH